MKIVRIAAGIVMLAALFYFRLIDLDELRKALAHPVLLGVSAIACMVTIPTTGFRWNLLLRAQGLNLHVWHTIRIAAMGAFFATFLPGAAGGDIVRGVYIYQASHGRRTSALLSIFIDRLLGVTAFVLFGFLATLTRSRVSYGPLEYGIFALTALFLGGLVVLFLFGHRIAQLLNLVFVGKSRRLASIIDDAGEALHQYAHAWPSTMFALGISMVTVFLVAFAVVAIAEATQFGGLTPVEYGIAGVYAMLANSLPLTPGGIGIGEGAFASACVALEPATAGMIPYGTIFLVFRCVVVISTLPGLIIYLIYPQRAQLLTPANSKS